MYCSNTDYDPEQHIHLRGKRNTLHEVCKAHLPCCGVRSHCFSDVLYTPASKHTIGACAPHVVCGSEIFIAINHMQNEEGDPGI